MAMEGTGKEKDPTDNAPILKQRPVSSLLSHFENLSHHRSASAISSSPHDSFLKTPEPSSRASLDLPPRSTRASTLDSHVEQQNERPNGRPDFTGSPGRFSRPVSMNFHSPHVGPTLTVDSPRSPPRRFPSPSPSDQHDVDIGRNSINASRESLASASSGGAFPRPTSPNLASSAPNEQKPGQLSPASNFLGRGLQSPPDRKAKSTSLPPPANRAEKPKIPAKPANLSKQDRMSLTPKHEKTSEDAVSPFNTPPSSPEKQSPEYRPSGRVAPSLPDRSGTEPPLRRSFDDRSAPDVRARHDARELGFSRSRPGPELPRNTKPLMVQIPNAHQQSEPLSSASSTAQKLQASDSPRDRPGLPPRNPMLPPRRSAVSPSRMQHTDGPPTPIIRTEPAQSTPAEGPPPPINRQPSFSRESKSAETPTRNAAPQVKRQSSFSREAKSAEAPPFPERRPARTPTEEEEPAMDEAPVRSDYPDASQANRRPPTLKTGPKEIHTRYDTRLMDVCGKYVCTTGYLTRVWDLTTGEQVVSLSHGETVKCLSLAFKPGKGLEDEGQRLWVGTSAGELHEVDIPSQSIVASRSYPSRREVIKILRNKKEMWTIDDEGRLLVWPPDETGAPNLQYSYHSPLERVARGQTFSMAIGDQLWLATGKDVHIYRPNAKDDVAFRVLKKPLGSQHTGEVTSGTYTSKDGGRVYLGHADGKVTIYSSADYSCFAVVNVSVYKINCLGIVGDYLWAAYKTGMIYVYDITPTPWVVKKDWRAHDSPVCGFLLDTSSVWKMNRLQVTSLGTDNCIRLWDGMLEDDFLETRMQSKDVEFCTFREIRAVIVTWNAGASTPGSVRTTRFIEDAVHPDNPPEILVFGFQELVDLENKKITAKSLLLSSKKKESGEKEHMSRQYRVWIEHLTRSVNECMPLDESYVLLHTSNMVGLFTCVFVKHKERQRVKSINSAEVKRGMGGLHGNKGALLLRFVLDDTSLCFINCHLAAGQSHTAHRNNDIAAILEAESLPVENNLMTRADHFVSGGDGSMIMDHEICILNGDLNYRIDSIPRHVIIEDVRNNNLSKLLDRDQLLASRRKNPGFRLRSFNEAAITFAPTYKYDVGSDEYDSSEKKRSPAWCDRVLYRGLGKIKQLEYRRHEVRASDHRPVSATFKLRIKTVQPKEREATWEVCQQEFQTERQRLASEASIEYLINVLGTDPQQARALIMGTGQK
ncbi:inositol polyphosphate phosphatase [Aspergillus sclerotialis]|uniref:Inositol polyphosphate phosphatase n=1 Tax=Aspergillus sclerotialis TaxID=2070753 RepID=A0A3A3A7R1_9EURO|nr:inositol polyphosphate phosphatase [Aspergillus sclerotialis]